MLAFSVMVIYISLCAAMQVIWEQWTFIDAVYAWFIAYSTVGFGDYIPFNNVVSRQDKHGITAAIFHVSATFPALFGLGIVASVINALFEVFDKYHLHIDSFYCSRSRSRGRRKNKETLKLIFTKMDAGDNLSHRRSHSV